MKKFYIFILFSFFSLSVFSQYYIDYKIRTDDFYADVADEWLEGDEEIVWKIKYKMGSSGSFSSSLVYEKKYNCDHGAWWNRSTDEIWSGTCLTSADDLYVFLEAWEEDGGNTSFGSGDDDYRSDTDHNSNIANDNRNSWKNFASNDGGDYVGAGTNSTGTYKVELDVWWNYTIPIVSNSLPNTTYNSIRINKSSGYYRVTSWYYQVSTNSSFTAVVKSGTTSSSYVDVTGLAPQTTYYVRIRGTNERGTGNYSSTTNTTTPEALSVPTGDGSEGNPYQIADIANLNWLRENSSAWDKHFIQTANIDASGTSDWNSGYGITGIGNSTTKFTGVYNGNNKTISNIEESTNYAVGLFGSISGATIKNLTITDANITSINSAVGLLAGTVDAQSIIYNCQTSGYIDGNQVIGGLVGTIRTGSSVDGCSSTATVSGNNFIGGLLGQISSSVVSNSYSTGSATADGTTGSAGGFVGTIYGNSILTNCYSTGKPSVTTGDIGGFAGSGASNSSYNCFWDTETSEQTNSIAGIGKTSAEMKTISTFTNSSWDFISPIWNINEGINNGYPNLTANSFPCFWTGNISSDWNTASNWNLGTIPTSNDHVSIAESELNPIVESGASADCNNLIIFDNASLTIASGGSIIPTGTITNNGTFNVEHSMSDGEWHYISSPVEGATANIFFGDYLQYYNESLPSDNYVDVSDETMPLAACQGFSWRNYSKSDFTFTGTPHHGDQSIEITANNAWGWNLVGNPYPSSIDWDLLNDTYNTIYIWTGAATEFSTYNDGAGTNGGTNEIAPMQGFLISTSTPGTFAVNNSHRIHAGADGYVKTKSELRNFTKLQLNSAEKTDELFIQFRENCSSGFDSKDGFKIQTSNPENINLYSKCMDGNLSIDRRPECTSIQLGIIASQAREMHISILESDYSYVSELEDTKLNIFHDLSKGAYSFNWEYTDSEERFVLHFKATGLEDLEEQEIQVYAANGQVYVRLDQPEDYEQLQLIDLSGRLIAEYQLQQQSLQSFDFGYLNGVYLVRLIGNKKTITKKVILK